MNFPRYWAKGQHIGKSRDGEEMRVEAFGWSSVSVEAARAKGIERAKAAVERGRDWTVDREHYEYGVVPPREEILESITLDGREIAVLSRNRYGAVVLNTASVLFVDVDCPRPQSNGILDHLLMAFSRSRRSQAERQVAQRIIALIEQWAGRNPTRAFRLYRTHSGFRLLFTDAVYDPNSPVVKSTFDELGADLLYVALTLRQECFRARLTPKPWRCDMLSSPPHKYPYETAEDEREHAAWLEEYNEMAAGCAVCELERQFGAHPSLPEIVRVLAIHDERCIVKGGPLV